LAKSAADYPDFWDRALRRDTMKRLLAIAVLLLASSAAQAQYQFEYGGRTIRIDPDRGTVSIPGVYDNTKKAKRAKGDDSSRNKPSADPQAAPAPADTAAAPPAAPAPPVAPPAPPPPATATTAPDQQPATTANSAPADTAALPPAPPPPPPAQAPSPPLQQRGASPAPPPPPAPTVAVAPSVAPAQAPAQQRRDTNSPLGVWLTEEKEGKVRIEQCGANLCGYSVDAKSNANGEQVLINMRPGPDKWSGRILDPNTGSTYDSTIALKGPDTLRVQGCAFGGMFCGGQTWTRVN
jgi:uncharacterized protein (DUF2147 family)